MYLYASKLTKLRSIQCTTARHNQTRSVFLRACINLCISSPRTTFVFLSQRWTTEDWSISYNFLCAQCTRTFALSSFLTEVKRSEIVKLFIEVAIFKTIDCWERRIRGISSVEFSACHAHSIRVIEIGQVYVWKENIPKWLFPSVASPVERSLEINGRHTWACSKLNIPRGKSLKLKICTMSIKSFTLTEIYRNRRCIMHLHHSD